MNRRGKLWFILQSIIFCAILLAPFIERSSCPAFLRIIGLLLLISGIIVAVLGYRTLGSSHSPGIRPVEEGHLVVEGIYRFVRHPVYMGWFLATLGFELLVCSVLGVGVAIGGLIFSDLKSREEEKWLMKKYAGYGDYEQKVRRFIPWLY